MLQQARYVQTYSHTEILSLSFSHTHPYTQHTGFNPGTQQLINSSVWSCRTFLPSNQRCGAEQQISREWRILAATMMKLHGNNLQHLHFGWRKCLPFPSSSHLLQLSYCIVG